MLVAITLKAQSFAVLSADGTMTLSQDADWMQIKHGSSFSLSHCPWAVCLCVVAAPAAGQPIGTQMCTHKFASKTSAGHYLIKKALTFYKAWEILLNKYSND